ncbi:MAG: hypothetical protein NZ518_06810 [Dehalococcoidia bacterium]|nr:hypothetical protein [Dehalococcoidia bacterium]
MTTEARPSRVIPKLPVEVWVFTALEAFRATAYRLESQRVSDIVNDILAPDRKGPRTRAIPLTNVTVHPLTGGDIYTTPFIALVKAQVVLLGEPTEPDPAPRRVDPAGGRWLPVSLQTANQCDISATVFCPPGKRLLDVVNDDREFLPLVDATVRWPAGVARAFAFVAVNKQQIVWIEEAS